MVINVSSFLKNESPISNADFFNSKKNKIKDF